MQKNIPKLIRFVTGIMIFGTLFMILCMIATHEIYANCVTVAAEITDIKDNKITYAYTFQDNNYQASDEAFNTEELCLGSVTDIQIDTRDPQTILHCTNETLDLLDLFFVMVNLLASTFMLRLALSGMMKETT